MAGNTHDECVLRGGGTVGDQLAIRELIERYCDACITRDEAAITELWVEDARWGVEGMPNLTGQGRDAIVAAWREGMGRLDFAYVSYVPGIIDIDGDTATGRTYTFELITANNGTGRKAYGYYREAFRREQGVWRFAERVWFELHEEGDYVHPGS